MIYEEILPDEALRETAAGYWRFSLPPGSAPPVHTIPPDGVVSLCWLPHGQAVVVGPRVTALRVPVQPGAEYAGIRFLPGAAGPLLGIDVVSLRGAMIGIDPPGFAEVMRSQGLAGLDALLLRWTKSARWPGPDPVVAELTRRILATDGAATVAELVAGLGLSYRQILRRFYQAAGLTPKEFARLRRLRAACLSAVQRADPGWATVSAEAGYADQSHLSREFQDVYGWPPRLVHEYLRRIDHRLAAR